MERRASSLSDLPAIAEALIAFCGEKRVLAFYGQMGAGKTTFIKALCETLGVTGATSSPTFSLVNEYRTRSGETVYHFDFYRIRKPEEATDMGFDEYLDSGSWCLIEWPEKVDELLPEGVVAVWIKLEGQNRMFCFGE